MEYLWSETYHDACDESSAVAVDCVVRVLVCPRMLLLLHFASNLGGQIVLHRGTSTYVHTFGQLLHAVKRLFYRLQYKLLVLWIDYILIFLFLLFDLLLRAHHNIIVVLHLAKARKNWHSDVTVAIN